MSIRRHTGYNLIGSFVVLAASLVTIPIYLSVIGEARYGVLAIAWLLLGYFGLFDFGLGRATAQRIAALRDATAAERAEAFWTALILNFGLGLVGALLMWPAARYFFGEVFEINQALRPEMLAAVPWLVLALPLATLAGVLSGALQGRERFLELNIVSVSGSVLSQLLPLAVAYFWRVDLGALFATSVAARLFTLFLLFDRCRRHLIMGQAVAFAREKAGHLLRFGGWVTVTAFVGPMMVILDRFLIGAFSGAKAVSYYTIPFQLAERSSVIPLALTTALFPRFAAASKEEEHVLASQGSHALAVVMTPLVVAGVLFMHPFLAWWISPEFAEQSSLAGKVILLGFWLNSFAKIPFAQLQARGRPDLVAKCHLAEVLPYLGLLYLGFVGFGLPGVAAAFSLRVIVDFLLLAGLAGLLPVLMRLLVVPALLLSAAWLIASLVDLGSPEWFLLGGGQLIITAIWAWRRAPEQLKGVLMASLRPLTNYLVRS